MPQREGSKPPTCEDVRPNIAALARGALGPVEEGTAFAHFLHCSDCAREFHEQVDRCVQPLAVQRVAFLQHAAAAARERRLRKAAGMGPLWADVRKALADGAAWAREALDAVRHLLDVPIPAAPLLLEPAPAAAPAARLRLRGPARGTPTGIRVVELTAALQPARETLFLVPAPGGSPCFLPDGSFVARLTLQPQRPRLEGRMVALTLRADGKPALTLAAPLRREADGSLVAEFREGGFIGLPPAPLPEDALSAAILPPGADLSE